MQLESQARDAVWKHDNKTSKWRLKATSHKEELHAIDNDGDNIVTMMVNVVVAIDN